MKQRFYAIGILLLQLCVINCMKRTEFSFYEGTAVFTEGQFYVWRKCNSVPYGSEGIPDITTNDQPPTHSYKGYRVFDRRTFSQLYPHCQYDDRNAELLKRLDPSSSFLTLNHAGSNDHTWNTINKARNFLFITLQQKMKEQAQ